MILTTVALVVLGALGAARGYHGPSLGGQPCVGATRADCGPADRESR